MNDQTPPAGTLSHFKQLGLPDPILGALRAVGYETPSPIQAAAIPPLLQGRDLLGQAQTGTGKTAAFALPILARLELAAAQPQALVLAPTRELAIQVAEAFQRYALYMHGFHVLPIYGGQGYGAQLSALRRGVHVVVGTPGRIMDHLERQTLDLSSIRTVILDEADEMLRMGFIDDVETILRKVPAQRQVALFSATLPAPIKRIAKTHLHDPAEVAIASRTATATRVAQRYWLVSGLHKLDALTRILEAEPFEGMIVFARTKQSTEELAERLQARGFSAAAINGDMQQPVRERTIAKLKEGSLDILVATDVAARGLDVERITHVVNYDMPYDAESYVHRIGRTGRAGRSGHAILFVTPRERHFLKTIERVTRQPIEPMELPSVAAVNDRRAVRFREKISQALQGVDLDAYRAFVLDYERSHETSLVDVAAALAHIARGDTPLFLKAPEERERARERPESPHTPRAKPAAGKNATKPKPRPKPQSRAAALYRIEVGRAHGAKPNQIVGAIANEIGMDSRAIGHIRIHDRHSVLELPAHIPEPELRHLKNVWVAGQRLRLSRATEEERDEPRAPQRPRPKRR